MTTDLVPSAGNLRLRLRVAALLACAFASSVAFAQAPARITIDDAIQMALQHNHSLLAARTTVQQSQAEEITAKLRPNPVLFADTDYLPLFNPQSLNSTYVNNSAEFDAGLSYLIERGGKRQDRVQAARAATAVATSQVEDNERALAFQVAAQFVAVQLAESTLDLAQQDLQSYQMSVDVSQTSFQRGAISQGDFLKIKLQLLQFQSDVSQAQLARIQALSDLRQLLGYESVPVDYDVAGTFDYQPASFTLEDLQMRALQLRPDYRAAQQSVTAANSQYLLAKANGKQDVTVQANYTHVNGISGTSFLGSIPLPIFNRNQGEIARAQYAVTQSEELEKAANEQVMTDVRDAFDDLQTADRVMQLYRSGYLDEAQQGRDISEYAYRGGAVTLLDFLDAERSYRTTELSYRQALANYLISLEHLREAVGTRNLP